MSEAAYEVQGYITPEQMARAYISHWLIWSKSYGSGSMPEPYATVMRAVDALAAEGVEVSIVTVGTRLRREGTLHHAGGMSLLTEMINDCPLGPVVTNG